MNSHPVSDHSHHAYGAPALDHLAQLRQIDIDNRTRALRCAAHGERLARSAAHLRHAERVHGASVPRPSALRVRLGHVLLAAGHALAQDGVERKAA